MRTFCLVLPFLSALSAFAVTLDVPKLPAPIFADGERSTTVALPTNRIENLRLFHLEITFISTPSNNVQVAFGRDYLPADGEIHAEEMDFIIGWDCGEWFLSPQGLTENYAFKPNIPQTGHRMLTVEIPVNAQGLSDSVVFRDGPNAFTFPGLKLSPFPAWLKPDLWTHLRVTVRGSDDADEKVRAAFLLDDASGKPIK